MDYHDKYIYIKHIMSLKEVSNYLKNDYCGVYGISCCGKILYIGSSRIIKERMEQHRGYLWHEEYSKHDNTVGGINVLYHLLYRCKFIVQAHIEIFELVKCDTVEESLQAERELILKYKPPFNVQIPNKHNDTYHHEELRIKNLKQLREYIVESEVIPPLEEYYKVYWEDIDLNQFIPKDMESK